MAKIVPLFSGSKGNCYYIGSGSGGVLIDAGRSCKQIENAMSINELDMRNIMAIFITHEHSDHCTALRVLASRYNTKVFASEGTLKELERSNRLDSRFEAEIITDTVTVGDMQIKRMNTSHDAAESCCYKVTTADDRSAVVATDLGCMSDEIRNEIMCSNLAVIESNHDVNMLRNGYYPYPVKHRILSDTGHMSNESCAIELPQFIKSGNNRIILGHLSQENNTPDVAFQTSLCILKQHSMKESVDFTLDIASPETRGKSFIF